MQSSKPEQKIQDPKQIYEIPLMRKMAEEMFGMSMVVATCEEEAAYGAALCARKLIFNVCC